MDEIDIDMGMQKVTVTGYAEQKKVLKAVRKTGRRAELWPFAYNPHAQHHYKQHQQMGPLHHVSYAAPSSHYNYYKHGYDSREYGYYHQHPGHSSLLGDGAGAMFSDDNTNACSIM